MPDTKTQILKMSSEMCSTSIFKSYLEGISPLVSIEVTDEQNFPVLELST